MISSLIQAWFLNLVNYLLLNKENIYDRILSSHKNDIVPFATTWIELKGITLNKISQA
jgi:hypothetical protein